jgi:malonyl-CoA O-methyltransferase
LGAEGRTAQAAETREPVIVSAREGYRRWASTYEVATNPIVSLVERNLDLGDTRGRIVVDVACGTGRRAKKIGAFGVDLSFEMLALGAGSLVNADALHLPFANETADLVLCTLAFGYISPVREVMTEMRRITRHGGTILAADVHPQATAAGWKRSFRDGDAVYEIENRPYSFDDLSVDGLVLEHALDLYFGEPERAIYEAAGKIELFKQSLEVPAAWIRRWVRQ